MATNSKTSKVLLDLPKKEHNFKTRQKTKKLLINENGEKRRNPCTVAYFRSGTQTLSSCCSLDYAHGNKSIIFFNDLYTPVKIYICATKKSTHLQVIPQQRIQNTTNLRLQTYEKNQWMLLLAPHGR